MSGKRFNPLEDPPSASSSDEDDQVKTTSLAGNSSSEDETDDESSKNPSSNKPESAPEKQQVSNSESGSDAASRRQPGPGGRVHRCRARDTAGEPPGPPDLGADCPRSDGARGQPESARRCASSLVWSASG